MDWRRNLLWIDCLAGLVAGVLMFSLSEWLAKWYSLPRSLLLFMGSANLLYASYSFFLATRRKRSMGPIVLLAAANLTWGLACMRWALVFGASASLLGTLHLAGEGLIVGGLAIVEWRARDVLATV